MRIRSYCRVFYPKLQYTLLESSKILPYIGGLYDLMKVLSFDDWIIMNMYCNLNVVERYVWRSYGIIISGFFYVFYADNFTLLTYLESIFFNRFFISVESSTKV